MNKQAQINLSFNMIVSVILIISFLFLGFFVIKSLIHTLNCTKTASFQKELQDKVESVWKSDESKQLFSHVLPSSIEKVCFADLTKQGTTKQDNDMIKELRDRFPEDKQFFLIPSTKCDLDDIDIPYINITKITQISNPYCIKNIGEVKLWLEKNRFENLVYIHSVEKGK